MAHSRTARKNIRKNVRNRVRNKAALSAMRTQIKRAETASGDAAAIELARAQKLVDKSAKKNRIHENKAARIKSRLARLRSS